MLRPISFTILIASTLSRSFTKTEVLRAYLAVAHFGTDVVGLRQAIEEISVPEKLAEHRAAYLIAHLRYPLPKGKQDSCGRLRIKRALTIAHYCESPSACMTQLTRFNDRKLLAHALQ